MNAEQVDAAIGRVPRWMMGLAIAGAVFGLKNRGMTWAVAFLIGAIAAYYNFWLIERAVNRLGELALAQPGRKPKVSGVWMFIRFAVFVLGASVILRLTGFNLIAALIGFLVCPGAVLLEIFYELLTYGHS